VLDSFGDAGRTAATACERPGPAAFVLVAQRVVACVLAVVTLELGGDVVAVAAAYLASSAIGLALLVRLLRRLGVRPRLADLRAADLRAMWRSTFLLGLDGVLGMALFRLDMLMLGHLAGDGRVAVYAVGHRLMETVLFVTWAVSRSLFPAMARTETGRPRLRVAENGLAVAGAIFVPYGLILLIDGGDLIELLFGGEYVNESVVALRWLAFAPVAFALGYFGSYLLFLQGDKRWMMRTTAAAVVVNAGLNVALIPAHGARGAALATTASYAFLGLIRVALLLRRAGWFRLGQSLGLPVAAALPMAGTLLVLGGLPFLLRAALAGVVYLAVYLALARWRDPGQLAVLRSLAPGR
jgi:O-antigen/teichoic acid export membrane protein